MQTGMFGLAAMLLLVALANIVMERARMADSAAGAASSAHLAGPGVASNTDPLADLGVIPSPAAPNLVRSGNNGHPAAPH